MVTQTPDFVEFLSQIFSFLYMYVGVPLAILLAFYILIAYCWNMIFGKGEGQATPQTRLGRGVATIFPFLLSLYSVVVSKFYELTHLFNLPFYVLLAIGMLIGFAFLFWISRIQSDDEIFARLSCFVASTIFFTILTAFVITRSIEILSFVFGFVFGICIYVMRYGFVRLDKITFPRPSFLRRKSKPLVADASKTK